MKLVDLKVGQGQEDAGLEIVRRFFSRLECLDGAGAGRLTLPRSEWFGRLVTEEQWCSAQFAKYLRAEKMMCENIRRLPRELIEYVRDTPEDPFLGGLEDADDVFLADVSRAGENVTCGVVLRTSREAPRVARVFDPSALQSALRRLRKSEV